MIKSQSHDWLGNLKISLCRFLMICCICETIIRVSFVIGILNVIKNVRKSPFSYFLVLDSAYSPSLLDLEWFICLIKLFLKKSAKLLCKESFCDHKIIFEFFDGQNTRYTLSCISKQLFSQECGESCNFPLKSLNV